MKALLHMMPRIWGLEGKVAGADLGMGKFQFDFDNEEDIVAVLKMEPFHFDNWMVSMVRWTPSVDPDYPSTLKFWVRVMNVPLQFWAEPTFRYIGKGLGHVEEHEGAVDLQKGRVQVTINGLKPLVFDTEIEFSNGEETLVNLWYERLHGYCEVCFSLCHESSHCQAKERVQSKHKESGEEEGDRKMLSYRGAVNSERRNGSGQEGKLKGTSQEISYGERSYKEEQRHNNGYQHGNKKPRADSYHGEGSSRYGRNQSYGQQNEHRERKVTARVEQKQAGAHYEVKTNVVKQGEVPSKQTRKALFHGDSGTDGQKKDALKISDQSLVQVGVAGAEAKLVVEKEKGVSLVMADCTDGTESLTQHADTRGSKEMEGITTNQVSGYTPLMESGMGGNEVLMEDKSLAEDDLLEDISVSSEQNADGTGEAEEGQMSDGEDDSNPNGSMVVSEAPIRNDRVVDTGKRVRNGGVLKGVSSKKMNAQLLLSPKRRVTGTSKDPVGESINRDAGRGGPGGAKPPKPKLNK
ncbi:unnamed protein product [Arabidopsis arenosa]|uniref:DUF4283 domain-containing protein n=1 Tax=Arabidopsis arenosa TaxID=38785 RepID=A0A8S2AVX0_ARAAE|nr:unnamed protein product [Arabidopsis arenosa]